ncbi:hypothetical protein EON65_40500 [archaeon]|nr:MAG: hypothetical protein EON65_40500 [archaeon]
MYGIEANDLLLQRHNIDYLYTNKLVNDEATTTSVFIRRLGCFSKLILNIFAHELIIAYRWNYEPSLTDIMRCNAEPVADHSLFVSHFHAISTMAFCIAIWDEEEEEAEEGSSSKQQEEEEEEEERYFSDGL